MFPLGIPLSGTDCSRVTHPSAAKTKNRSLLSPLDLHVLGTPPAFVLSQDQTLMFNPYKSSHANAMPCVSLFRNLTVLSVRLPYIVFKDRCSRSLGRGPSLECLISIPHSPLFVNVFSQIVLSYYIRCKSTFSLSIFFKLFFSLYVTLWRYIPLHSHPHFHTKKAAHVPMCSLFLT